MAVDKKDKIAYLELLRIIACFFVIVNHTNSGIFLTHGPDSRSWWISLAYFFLCKTAVPIFIMITGALMLGRSDSSKKYWTRILRIVLVILLFSAVYYIYGRVTAGGEYSVLGFLKGIYRSHITNAYWYLYMYLGMLIMMPIFQVLGTNMKKREYGILFGVTFGVLGILPILSHYKEVFAVDSNFKFAFFSAHVALLFLGYYLSNFVSPKGSIAALSLVVLIAVIILEVFLTYKEYLASPEWYLFYDDIKLIFIPLCSAAIYYIARYLQKVISSEKFWAVIKYIGGCCFGIYLLSDLFVDIYAPVYLKLCGYMHGLIAVLIYEVMIFGTGLLITIALKQIPGLKKLI